MPSKTTFYLSENALTTDSVYHVHESSFPSGKVPETTPSSLRSSLNCLVSMLPAYLPLQKALTFAIEDSSLTEAEGNHEAICILLIN